jgi:ribosomal protein S18 acetylase RimI-like enzyme
MVEALEFHIRPAVEADLPGMEWEGEYSQYRRVYRHVMEEMQLGKRLILVAECDGFVVGQIFIQFEAHRADIRNGSCSAYLHAFRVRRAYRNRGIGTNLVLEAEAVLRDTGCERVVIAAAEENLAAQRLYERLGYVFYKNDPGQWSFIDHKGRLIKVNEPSVLLEKWL